MNDLPIIPANVPDADNTCLSDFESCPRKYKLRHVDGWSSKGKAPALGFGGLIHDGLQIWYETGDAEAMLDYVASADYLEIEGDHRTRGRALTTLTEYVQYYRNEPWERILLTETPFTVTDSRGFRYGGKIDLIVVQHGGLWIVDHKTTSRAGASWWNQWKNSPQMVGYTWAGEQLAGQPIRGVIINRILIHKKKKAPEEEFARRPILYSKEKVQEWYDMRVETYQELSRCFEADHFRPRWDSCIGKYGPCVFHDVCVAPPHSRKEILESEFEVRPWNWLEDDVNQDD